jgi:hypothetical protein
MCWSSSGPWGAGAVRARVEPKVSGSNVDSEITTTKTRSKNGSRKSHAAVGRPILDPTGALPQTSKLPADLWPLRRRVPMLQELLQRAEIRGDCLTDATGRDR